jgi:hypothetical protein
MIEKFIDALPEKDIINKIRTIHSISSRKKSSMRQSIKAAWITVKTTIYGLKPINQVQGSELAVIKD